MLMSEERRTESSGRPTNSNFSKAVEIGKEYTAGRDGEGVARIGGLITFVNNAKVGDRNIKIKINSVVRSRFATAEVVASSTDTT
jgi:predicted RNA-binding protein with TRAM domain